MYSFSAHPTPLSFDKAWTLEDTRAMYAHEQAFTKALQDPANEKDLRDAQQWRHTDQDLRHKLSLAIYRHLAHVAATQGVEMPAHAQGLQTRFSILWKSLAQGEELPERQAYHLGEMFLQPLMRKLAEIDSAFTSSQRPAPSFEQVHEFFQRTIQEGDFPRYMMERQDCRLSGISIIPEMRSWKPRVLVFDPKLMAFRDLKQEEVPVPQVHHTTIPVPSGKLLIADWFRHNTFTALAEQAWAGSLSSAWACAQKTRAMAEKLGVAHVFVGNTSPSVVADQSGVRVGCLDDEAQAIEQGSVCTDLWWVSMVDKQVLVDLLAQKMPHRQAQREVEELVANQAGTGDVMELEVAPGTHHLYYSGDPDLFAGLFDRQGVDWQEFTTPMFILSPKDLAPRPSRSGPKP